MQLGHVSLGHLSGLFTCLAPQCLRYNLKVIINYFIFATPSIVHTVARSITAAVCLTLLVRSIEPESDFAKCFNKLQQTNPELKTNLKSFKLTRRVIPLCLASECEVGGVLKYTSLHLTIS